MIVYENIPAKVSEYRGTIEVYTGPVRPGWVSVNGEWRFRTKARNHEIVGHGKGYRRRAGVLNAINTQYAVKLVAGCPEWVSDVYDLIVPWRVVILDRHGDIDKIGALY